MLHTPNIVTSGLLVLSSTEMGPVWTNSIFLLQIFHFRIDQENRVHNMFPQEVIPQMFSNIKSIYQFHHDFLLPQLEARMTNWDRGAKIGKLLQPCYYSFNANWKL
jgi:hypothetical protein